MTKFKIQVKMWGPDSDVGSVTLDLGDTIEVEKLSGMSLADHYDYEIAKMREALIEKVPFLFKMNFADQLQTKLEDHEDTINGEPPKPKSKAKAKKKKAVATK